ncbi:MarR family winged helix-turn-helix transcriptional regulator [Actinosynnema sp. CS-041913]|uniref:MarR family winged helix-turn-helix transcriptional regulator n=1 Tax=Actinosynnema sp. CS-041913 TaxID=3239917 RepID=UPI003D8A5884
MTHFTQGGDTLAFESAAAVRTAAQAVERLRAKGADSRGGLSSGALDLLIRLSVAGAEGASIGDLPTSAQVSARNATGLVDTLEREGLATRAPHETDRRSVRAKITPTGEKWVNAFRRPSEVAMGALFRGFTTEELTLLRHLCLKLADNVESLPGH